MVLLIALIYFLIYSFSNSDINLFGVTLKKPEITSILLAQNQETVVTKTETKKSDTIKSLPPVRTMDSSEQKILFIGDSMVESLMHRLNDYAYENKHKLYPVIWFSSSTKAYGQSTKLKTYIEKYKPTIILIALGSNELFVRDLPERDKYIKKILKQIDTNKFLWIGPPNWKEDTGINDLIQKNIEKERFFLSKHLKFDRASDGAHPTLRSANEWCDKICEWITKESKYPILLNYPAKHTPSSPNAVRMVYE